MTSKPLKQTMSKTLTAFDKKETVVDLTDSSAPNILSRNEI
jgi:hypothetical protein